MAEGAAMGAGAALGAVAVWGIYKWITGSKQEQEQKTKEVPFEGRVLGEVQEENFLLDTGETAETLFDYEDIDAGEAIA